MKQVNLKEFDELLKGDKPVVCDFYANWCGPCKMLAPVMEQVSEKYSDRAEFVKVDVDENAELSMRYGVMSIPFVAVFKGGELAAKTVGYMSKSEADEFVSENI